MSILNGTWLPFFTHSLIINNQYTSIMSNKQFRVYHNISSQLEFSQKTDTKVEFIGVITLDSSSLLKNHFECSFVSSECSLQSSNVCFEARSEYLR